MQHSFRLTTALAATLAVTGCGGGLMAPEGPAANAFLNKVDANCGKLTVGIQPIDYMLSNGTDDTTFLDETGKFGAGEMDKAAYASSINSFYPAGDNTAAINCVAAQLD
jgi:hypothetical protein